MKPLAIIPARGGSKRFPRKNVALLKGKPLIAYAIEAAKESGVFDTVLVSSEDDEILKVAEQCGADEVRKRPEEFAGDNSPLRDLCAYLLKEYEKEGKEYESFALLTPTNPLRAAEDIREAYRLFCEKDANHVMALMHCPQPPEHAVRITEEGLIEPAFGWDAIYRQSQAMEKMYWDCGSINFAKTDVFLKEGDFYGSKMVPYIMPPERCVDIDVPKDLEWAEFLLS